MLENFQACLFDFESKLYKLGCKCITALLTDTEEYFVKVRSSENAGA